MSSISYKSWPNVNLVISAKKVIPNFTVNSRRICANNCHKHHFKNNWKYVWAWLECYFSTRGMPYATSQLYALLWSDTCTGWVSSFKKQKINWGQGSDSSLVRCHDKQTNNQLIHPEIKHYMLKQSCLEPKKGC